MENEEEPPEKAGYFKFEFQMQLFQNAKKVSKFSVTFCGTKNLSTERIVMRHLKKTTAPLMFEIVTRAMMIVPQAILSQFVMGAITILGSTSCQRFCCGILFLGNHIFYFLISLINRKYGLQK